MECDPTGWSAQRDGVANFFQILKELLMIGINLRDEDPIAGGEFQPLHDRYFRTIPSEKEWEMRALIASEVQEAWSAESGLDRYIKLQTIESEYAVAKGLVAREESGQTEV